MYNQHERSVLKQQFWTAFGQYMAPIHSSEGAKINWVNYKTGIKDIYFKMDAGAADARISIQVTHADPAMQSKFFNLFKQLKTPLESALQEEWQWALQMVDEDGKIVSSMYTLITNVSIYTKEDWPMIISFFKPRLIALDAFWNTAKFGFDI